MSKIIAKAWLTLDGVFDGRYMNEWFNPYHTESRAQVIVDTVNESDGFIYGRKTYDMLAPYWSSLRNNEMGIAAHLNAAPKYVVTSSRSSLEWHNSTVISDDPVAALERLKAQHPRQLVIDGSATLVRSLRNTGLIDEYQLLLHPLVLGYGDRYFQGGDTEGLDLEETRTLEQGVLFMRYRPVRVDAP